MGVILKAPDEPEIVDAIGRLQDAGIPVVTLVTDIPLSGRVAYVGIDNRAAGATAAYLIDQWLGDDAGAILMALSRSAFRGEEEREMGFAQHDAGTSRWSCADRGHRHRRPRHRGPRFRPYPFFVNTPISPRCIPSAAETRPFWTPSNFLGPQMPGFHRT